MSRETVLGGGSLRRIEGCSLYNEMTLWSRNTEAIPKSSPVESIDYKHQSANSK
jgi:hypothetical protein